MSGQQPPLFEVATKTTRAPNFTGVLWFDVVIRVGGVPVLTARYSTTSSDPERAPAESAAHAERQARAQFGQRLADVLTPVTFR